jgi:hypothetical protein
VKTAEENPLIPSEEKEKTAVSLNSLNNAVPNAPTQLPRKASKLLGVESLISLRQGTERPVQCEEPKLES